MQFLLPPWDRNRPRIHPPQADSLVTHGGKTFALRAQNGLLFFRDVADQAKTWAIATPLSPELEQDVTGREAFFQREFEKGNVARYVVHLDSYLDRTVPLFFRGDGTGWCRESWNRDDIPFSHSVSMHVLLEGDDRTIEQEMGAVESQLEQQLSNLDWPDDVQWGEDEEGAEWLCGSRENLQDVLEWICSIETSFWKVRKTEDVQLLVASETPFSRAHVLSIVVGKDHKRNELFLEADMQSDKILVGYGFGDVPGFDAQPMPSRRFWTLCDLVLDENTPVGTYWEYHDYGLGRCADAPNPISLTFQIPAPTSAEIEGALLRLRMWLKGKVPASEIEELLGDETPGEIPKAEW